METPPLPMSEPLPEPDVPNTHLPLDEAWAKGSYSAKAMRADRAARDAMWAERLAKLEVDAARYRWLRDKPEWLGWDHDFRPDEVERELDAAMAAKEPR